MSLQSFPANVLDLPLKLINSFFCPSKEFWVSFCSVLTHVSVMFLSSSLMTNHVTHAQAAIQVLTMCSFFYNSSKHASFYSVLCWWVSLFHTSLLESPLAVMRVSKYYDCTMSNTLLHPHWLRYWVVLSLCQLSCACVYKQAPFLKLIDMEIKFILDEHLYKLETMVILHTLFWLMTVALHRETF